MGNRCCGCLKRRTEPGMSICDHLEVGPSPLEETTTSTKSSRRRRSSSAHKHHQHHSMLKDPLLPAVSGDSTPIADTPCGHRDDAESCSPEDACFESCVSLGSLMSAPLTRRDSCKLGTQKGGSPCYRDRKGSDAVVELPKTPDDPLASPLASLTSIPADVARGVTAQCKAKPKLLNSWDFLEDKSNIAHLKTGGSLYCFTCQPGTQLSLQCRDMAASFINISVFSNPAQAQNVHPIDMNYELDLESHIFIMNKAMYCLPPPLKCEDFTPELLSSVDYQKKCQPQSPKVWTDVTDPNTFRITKSIVAFVYSVTIQLRISVIPTPLLQQLSTSVADGIPLHHGLLFERTKRDKTYVDSTKVVKSLLLFHAPSEGGLVVTNVTVVANTALPSIVAKIVDSFGSSGAKEVAETAEKTRQYMCKRRH